MNFVLPQLLQVPSPNFSHRVPSVQIDLIVCHDCEGSYHGSINWFARTISEVSAHIVLNDDGTEATQCVPFLMKAWHACNVNPRSIGVEISGYSRAGFSPSELNADATIVAWLLHTYGIPLRWAARGQGPGFCSHWDTGVLGGGHSDITTDPATWTAFADRVAAAYAEMGKARLPIWGLHLHPDPLVASTPPEAPAGWVPSGTKRAESGDAAPYAPIGSILGIQQRLIKDGEVLKADGLYGPRTKAAIMAFQQKSKLKVDGIIGPVTRASLALAA